MPYASKTEVPAEQSRAEIERLITKHGARSFQYGHDPEKAMVQFEANSRMIRFTLKTPPLNEFRYRKQAQDASNNLDLN